MLGRIEVQPNNIGGFGLELGIIGRHIALQSMGPEPVLGPHPSHGHVRYSTQFTGKLTTRPVSRSIGGLSLSRPGKNLGLQSLVDLVTCPSRMAAEQTCQSLGDKPAPPARDKSGIAAELLTNRDLFGSLGQQQNQPGSTILRDAHRLRPANSFQFLAFDLRQLDFFHQFVRRYSCVTIH